MLPCSLICLVHLHQSSFFDLAVQLWYHLCLTPPTSSARGYCLTIEGTGIVLRVLLCLRKIPANSYGMLHKRPHWLKLSSFIAAVILESEEGMLISLLLQIEWEDKGFAGVCRPCWIGFSAVCAFGAGWGLFRTISFCEMGAIFLSPSSRLRLPVLLPPVLHLNFKEM